MKKLYLIAPLIVAISLIIYIKLFLPEQKQKAQITVFEFGDGALGESMDVPSGKYPYGFPIEILDYKDEIIEGQRYISGYCCWHLKSDSALGGKVAVVPVLLYRLHYDTKRIDIVGQTITRRSDGYFKVTTPSLDGEYSIGVRIEKAESCPERYKKHPPKEDKKKEEKPIKI